MTCQEDIGLMEWPEPVEKWIKVNVGIDNNTNTFRRDEARMFGSAFWTLHKKTNT